MVPNLFLLVHQSAMTVDFAVLAFFKKKTDSTNPYGGDGDKKHQRAHNISTEKGGARPGALSLDPRRANVPTCVHDVLSVDEGRGTGNLITTPMTRRVRRHHKANPRRCEKVARLQRRCVEGKARCRLRRPMFECASSLASRVSLVLFLGGMLDSAENSGGIS